MLHRSRERPCPICASQKARRILQILVEIRTSNAKVVRSRVRLSTNKAGCVSILSVMCFGLLTTKNQNNWITARSF